MPIETSETYYSDLPLKFVAHPVTGNINILKNTDAISKSVTNIVLTNFYERPYAPTFGANILAQMFENMDSQTEYLLRKNIEVALRNYEPRANVLNVIVSAIEDRNSILIKIVYRPVNATQVETLDIMLERVR